MKRQIRRGTFETNSSSTHSLSICSEEKFNQWENGKLAYREYEDEFVKIPDLSRDEKERARQDYEDHKDEYAKDWDELPEDLKEKYYTKYAEDIHAEDIDAETFREWSHDCYLETFIKHYTTESGDKIVAFGKWGYE